MSETEIYNMKVNMGLLDLQKYNSLVKEIENIPQRYIDGLELEKIAFNIKEELKLNNDENLDELVELYSAVVFNLHSNLGNTLSELEFKFNQVKIQARLKAIQNPSEGKFNLNGKLDFKDLNQDIIALLDRAYNLVKAMEEAIGINILSASDKDSIDKIKESINSLHSKNTTL